MKINHFGIACENIQESVAYFKCIYEVVEVSDIIYDPLQEANVCLMTIKNSIQIELVSGDPVKNYLSRGISIYHICYETTDLNATIKKFTENGATIVSSPKPAKLFNDRLVCFLQTNCGLIELLEAKADLIEIKNNDSIVRFLIAANFTARPILPSLECLLNKLNIQYEVFFSPYNQIIQELMDDTSLLASNILGINVLLVSFYEWIYYHKNESDVITSQQLEKISNYNEELIAAIKYRAPKLNGKILIVFCKPNPSVLNDFNRQYFDDLEKKFILSFKLCLNVHLIQSCEIDVDYKVNNYFNKFQNTISHIPYTEDYFFSLGASIIRKYYAITQPPHKVIVIDCDNTLWEGVCSEVGPTGIAINEPEKMLQQFLVDQINKGMIVCLCSKNVELDVIRVFNENKNMILTLDKITAYRINWQKKPQNIKELAETLRLSLSSFIFIDDNELECMQMATHLPEVLTIHLPANRNNILNYLRKIWVFDKGNNLTDESEKRTRLYKEEAQRIDYQNTVSSFDEFINGLQLKATIKSLNSKYVTRAEELIQRTTQFNLTNTKHSALDIQNILNDSNFRSYYLNVKDRFGDYGITGLLISHFLSDSLWIDVFLLSCRILGRKIEIKMLAYIKKLAEKQNKKFIIIPLIKTNRNEPALTFIEGLPYFHKKSDGVQTIYTFKVENLIQLEQQQSFQKTKIQHHYSHKEKTNPHINIRNRQLLEIANMTFQKFPSAIHRKKSSLEETSFPVFSINYLKKYLINIFEKILNVEKISADDSFINLDVDSIDAVKIISRIKSELNLEIGIKEFFEKSTIQMLTKTLISKKNISHISLHDDWNKFVALLPSEHNNCENIFPLSCAQEALWKHEKICSDIYIYNMPVEFIIDGELDIPTLNYSFQRLIYKHPALRSIFIELDGKPFQKILPDFSIAIQLEDARSLSEKDIEEIIFTEEKTKFNLNKGPLLRTRLLKIDNKKYLFILMIHHIIFDGWSYRIIFDDLKKFYSSYRNNVHFVENNNSVQYVDFTRWENKLINSNKLDKQINYWKKKLSNFKLCPISYDLIKEKTSSNQGNYMPIQLHQDYVKKIKSLCLQYDVSLYTVLVSIFDLLIHIQTMCKDICIGTIVSTRKFQELENIVGFFINAVPLRINLTDDLNFKSLLMKNKNIILEAFQNQDPPFGKIIEAVKSTFLFQVIFLYQNTLSYNFELEGLKINKFREGYNIARSDLVLELQEKENYIYGGFYFKPDLFKASRIATFVRQYQSLLKLCVNQPKKLLSNIVKDTIKHDQPLEVI